MIDFFFHILALGFTSYLLFLRNSSFGFSYNGPLNGYIPCVGDSPDSIWRKIAGWNGD